MEGIFLRGEGLLAALVLWKESLVGRVIVLKSEPRYDSKEKNLHSYQYTKVQSYHILFYMGVYIISTLQAEFVFQMFKL